jgi:hypothetical protein
MSGPAPLMPPPSQRLVLHVGPHKTATTYIQNNLAAYRDTLDQAGWLYPDNIGIMDGVPEAHHDLAYRAETYFWPGRDNHHQLTGLAARARATQKNLLLSAEGFSMWSLSQYLRLADILGCPTVEVVYALRDPVALLHSYWAEEVKQGMTASFPDRIAGVTLDPLRSRLLNPLFDLNPLIASDRITLRLIPFEILKSTQTDIFSHLCDSVLGLGPLPPRMTGLVNQGFPIEQTELLRMLTLIHGQGQTGQGPDLRMRFIRRTTPTERSEWNARIRDAASDALREVAVPADALFRIAIESRVIDRAGAFTTLPIQNGELFNRTARSLAYYDDYLFWNNPVVKALADIILTRIAQRPSTRAGAVVA